MRPTISEEIAEALEKRVDQTVRVDAGQIGFEDQLRILLEDYDELQQQGRRAVDQQQNTIPRR